MCRCRSAIPTFGTAWTLSLSYILKIFGSQLVAVREYDAFAKLARLISLCGVCYALISIGAVLGYDQPLASVILCRNTKITNHFDSNSV